MENKTNKTHLRVQALCEGAIMVAIAQVLGYLKLFGNMVNGGSVTFAASPLVLFALRWGLGKGLLASFCFGVLQMIFDGAYAWGWQSMLLLYTAGSGRSVQGQGLGHLPRCGPRKLRALHRPFYQRRNDLSDL